MTLTTRDLPAHLAERARNAGPRESTVTGEFVLYWMHHAVRAEENPALDTACAAALSLGLPLLVYQGLGGRHRYDSDRHHTFILEGARVVAAVLAARGIRHVFRLARTADEPSPLSTLAARAALVVSEDFPAPPFPAWSATLARQITAPLWLVDSACILPMQLAPRGYARAFEFRRAHGAELERRAHRDWPPVGESPAAYAGPLGFEPIDLAHADLAALCAGCAIDHAVAPAPATRGGSDAGLARWAAFLANGLASYDRLRNDAAVQPPHGTSRLSAYLHHGHLSPLRIARDAARHGSTGAVKFLDELLIWRELAHNFCFHHALLVGGLEHFTRLPAWARDTLSVHAADPREADYDWERLARGETGDPLWDAAQHALLIHGELHNNLRMTWGKALLRWTRSPQRALELMFDLNHRYALDGSDPNSYGGLLYCLGLFDRAFTPAQPISGTVRARPTHQHARRLDLDAYRAYTGTRRSGRIQRVAVIGAGIAGLTAARTLADQGFSVSVFERSRSVGGRAAGRLVDGHSFDHGAQYFTARDPRFVRYVEAWQQAGLVAPWHGRIVAIDAQRSISPVPPTRRYVGVPGMNALAQHLARNIEVQTHCNITQLTRRDGGWELKREDDMVFGQFDALLIAAPPAQVVRLVAPSALLQTTDQVELLPCWCAMLTLRAPLRVDFAGAFVDDSTIAWIARDSSKPGRPPGERWVIHAAADWSAQRLTAGADVVADALMERFFALLQQAPSPPEHLSAHRWSYARPARSGADDCLWRPADALAVCGDWCRGGRIEGAFLSGAAGAGRIAAVAHQGIG